MGQCSGGRSSTVFQLHISRMYMIHIQVRERQMCWVQKYLSVGAGQNGAQHKRPCSFVQLEGERAAGPVLFGEKLRGLTRSPGMPLGSLDGDRIGRSFGRFVMHWLHTWRAT